MQNRGFQFAGACAAALLLCACPLVVDDDYVIETASVDAGPGAGGSAGAKPSASCDDAQKNGDETDVDCGGSCSGCHAGDDCESSSDCAGELRCDEGRCGEEDD